MTKQSPVSAADTGNLVQFLKTCADTFGDRTALLYKPSFRYQKWSYAHLWEEAGRMADLLRQRGLEKGDRAVIWAHNCPQWVIAYFGCLRAGVVLVPLDVRSTLDFAQGVIARTDPKLAFISRATPEAHTDMDLPEIAMEEIDALLRDVSETHEVPVEPDDLVEIIFTSGTTGNPKGVMLTHANLIANLDSITQFTPGEYDDRFVSILPLSHMFEQMGGLLVALRCGANVTYPVSRQPAILRKLMRERRVTLMLLVPQVLELFMAGIEREVRQQGKEALWAKLNSVAARLPMRLRRLLFKKVHQRMGGSLKLLISGGAALGPELGDKWNRMGIDVIQAYGATETSPGMTMHKTSDPRYDSAGLPVPGVDIRIADDGEILARGANVTPGYWEDPVQTKAVLEDGWYKTGDLGAFDEQGYLHIKGRKKDMIVLSSGQNVYPEDIEATLKKHDGVTDAVVVGVPRGSDVEVHAAMLMAESSVAADAVNWANAQLADHQQVRAHTIWPNDDFPRTHTMKVKKNLVLDALMSAGEKAEPAAAPPSSNGTSARGLRHLIAEISGMAVDKIEPNDTLGSDVGLDSLGRVELLSTIEQELGAYIDEAMIGTNTTVDALEQLVAQQAQAAAKAPAFYRWSLTTWCGAVRNLIHYALVSPLLASMYRREVKGLENLKGVEGPVVFAINHNGIQWDSLAVRKSLPAKWRGRLSYAAAAEITFGKRWLGTVGALVANAFPLSRDSAIRVSMEHIGSILDDGWSVGLFPEGDQQVGNEMMPFKPGIGLLAVECRTPVVPVHVVSTAAKEKANRYWPWPPEWQRVPVTVNFGKPIFFSPETDYTEATDAIQNAVKAL